MRACACVRVCVDTAAVMLPRCNEWGEKRHKAELKARARRQGCADPRKQRCVVKAREKDATTRTTTTRTAAHATADDGRERKGKGESSDTHGDDDDHERGDPLHAGTEVPTPPLTVDSSHMCIHGATGIAPSKARTRPRTHGQGESARARIRNTRTLQLHPSPSSPLLRQTDACAEVRQQRTQTTRRRRIVTRKKERRRCASMRAPTSAGHSGRRLRARRRYGRTAACEPTAVFSPSFALTASCASRPGAAAPPPSPARHSTPA